MPDSHSETLLTVLENGVAALESTRQRPTHPNLVLAGRVLVEQRIEGDHTLHVSRAQVEPLRDELDRIRREPVAVGVLAQVKHRDARGHLVWIARQDLGQLTLVLLTQDEGHAL
jgi:hypothetical protein